MVLVEGNNLFGQWCYNPGCGIVPRRRLSDATHEVQKFDSISDAIASYLNNLNSHRQYDMLRTIRADLKSNKLEVSGLALAEGLLFYSERRQEYVDEVKAMIRQYHRYIDNRQASDD